MKRLLLATASVLALSAYQAKSGPIALAIAGTAASYATGTGLLFAGAGLSTAGLLGANFAVRAALGYAINGMVAQPSPVSRGYQVNTIGSDLAHQIIYGETVVGGVKTYQTLTTDATSDDLLHIKLAYAGHQVQSFEAIYVNGEEVALDGSGNVTAPAKWVGLIRIKELLGTDAQVADPDMVAEITEWTSNHRGRGVASLYCRFKGFSNFPNGEPTVTAKIRGRKIEDTRVASTAYSNNPALCVRDYFTADFGLAENASEMDDTLIESAADDCEVQVASKNTYECNGAFLTDSAPEDILQALLSSMGGTLWNSGGLWGMKAAKYTAPTIHLTKDDLRTNMSAASRSSARDDFNGVKGIYRGEETSWESGTYPVINPGLFLREDNNEVAIEELNLPFTTTTVMAQRIARTFLRRNRKGAAVVAGFGLQALKLRVGDTTTLTVDRPPWSQKEFEVVDWRLSLSDDLKIMVNMILRETSEDIFTGIVKTLADESGNTLTDESGNTLEAIVA